MWRKSDIVSEKGEKTVVMKSCSLEPAGWYTSALPPDDGGSSPPPHIDTALFLRRGGLDDCWSAARRPSTERIRLTRSMAAGPDDRRSEKRQFDDAATRILAAVSSSCRTGE